MAREVGLNERHLKTGFWRLLGNSVHAYLRQIRIEAVSALLLAGSSVTEVALESGFTNLNHFSKTFRQVKGVLLGEFMRH